MDFANEGHAWNDLTIETADGKGKTWLFNNKKVIDIFNSKDIRDLGDNWYVLFFYVLNLIMVGIDLLLYVRNYWLEKGVN